MVRNVTPLYTAEDARNAKFNFKLALSTLISRYMVENEVDSITVAEFMKWCRKRSYPVLVAENVYREAYSNSQYQFYSFSDRLHNWVLSLPGYLLVATTVKYRRNAPTTRRYSIVKKG